MWTLGSSIRQDALGEFPASRGSGASDAHPYPRATSPIAPSEAAAWTRLDSREAAVGDVEWAAVAGDDRVDAGVGLGQQVAGEVLRREHLAPVELDVGVAQVVLVLAQTPFGHHRRVQQLMRD